MNGWRWAGREGEERGPGGVPREKDVGEQNGGCRDAMYEMAVRTESVGEHLHCFTLWWSWLQGQRRHVSILAAFWDGDCLSWYMLCIRRQFFASSTSLTAFQKFRFSIFLQ